MNINLAFCTQTNDSWELVARPFNILDSKNLDVRGKKVTLKPQWSNTTPLPKMYNKVIREITDESIVVLAHDDLIINDANWTTKLEKALELYDVVGLAGGRDARIQEPALWHIMCPRDTLSGTVKHVNFADNSVYATNFGPVGRVLMLDGLFLAFKPSVIKKAEVKFDESNPCIAHFYDLDFSLTCNKHGLKLGTVNIDVTHSSPGLKSYTPEWLAGQKWFLDKYKRGEY